MLEFSCEGAHVICAAARSTVRRRQLRRFDRLRVHACVAGVYPTSASELQAP